MDTNTILSRIVSSAARDNCESEEHVLEQIRKPRWDETTKVHDWRNYVTEELWEMWNELDPLARAVAYRFASCQAFQEEWD